MSRNQAIINAHRWTTPHSPAQTDVDRIGEFMGKEGHGSTITILCPCGPTTVPVGPDDTPVTIGGAVQAKRHRTLPHCNHALTGL